MTTDLPTPTPEALAEARLAAEQAEDIKAELTRQLQAQRARCKSLWKRYEDLLAVAQGQETLDLNDTTP